jgi:cell wall-associated NlpC family hydrolase
MPAPRGHRQLHSTRTRRRAGFLFVPLLAVVCALAVVGGAAPAQDLQRKLERDRAELAQVQERQRSLAGSIAEQNARINDLIAEVSALRARQAEVRERLTAKEAELGRATAALRQERAHLEVVRERLRRAMVVLRRFLVGVYESGDPDVVSIILESTSWSDALAQTEYLERIRSYEDTVVGRVKTLRDQTRAAVKRLHAAREQIEAARDAIAARERQLERNGAVLEQRYAEFVAARGARQRAIDALQSREEALQDNLSAISNQLVGSSSTPAAAPPPVPGQTAVLQADGQAAAPADAPQVVKDVIAAANQISGTPYIWGGGHGSWESAGYDCSGAVSYALHGGGLLDSPLDSTGLSTWGEAGVGNWITVYAYSGHAYAVIAGLRWDTSDTGGSGPRWHTDMRSSAGFIARHPPGY